MASVAAGIFARVELAAQEALRASAEELKLSAEADMPVGDPQEDPDPEVSLRERMQVDIVKTHTGHVAVVRDTAPYAKKQHEAQHFKHPRGGRSKYLESNLKAIAPRFVGRLEAGVRRALGGR